MAGLDLFSRNEENVKLINCIAANLLFLFVCALCVLSLFLFFSAIENSGLHQ
ncbi:hypothetical protein BCR43DRAFT_482254 [Syncephalastrum racemosum]|uniref:Uncharacterized protein n=1 Tax=Syncephalastrum racemosum TaxID=13706 RepID=A0A1X2HTF7_SYNRA|nr:hypothetical protein BCR43DRAFT_482254 [Syncephalastrum racemosum]